MKKRFLGLVLACTLAATSLIGCGSGNTSADPTTAAEEEGTTTDGGAEQTSGSGEQTTLKWAVWDIAMTTYYEPVIEAFEAANPNVKIEMVDLGSADYQTVLATELTGSGSDFDVVMVKDIPGYATLVNKGVLEPLNDYIEKDGIDLSGYNGITEQIEVDGNLYQLPFRSDFWVMFYNKDIFDAADVDYPTNDMTFEEYDALARSVTNTTPGEEVYGAHYHTWRSAVQLFGILDGENSIVDGDISFTKPYYEMVLAQQNDGVCQDYATLRTRSLHYSGAFAQSDIAMMNMGSWFIPTLIEKVKTGEYADVANWGIVKYPHAEGVEPGSTLATITALAIPKNAPHKDAAWEFVKFVSGPEGATLLAETGTIPALMTDEVVKIISSMDGFPADPESAEALKTSNTYLEMPLHERSAELEIILNEGHDSIMTEAMSLDEGIADMNEKVQEILGQ